MAHDGTGRVTRPHGPRVVVADDHAPFRDSIREELERAGFVVCAEVETAGEAVEAAAREQPDLCLLDVRMSGNGLRAAALISSALPSATIVILTQSDREEDVLEAVRSGASGYLLKGTDPQRFPIALRDALAGTPAFPRRLMAPLVRAARHALGPPRTTSE